MIRFIPYAVVLLIACAAVGAPAQTSPAPTEQARTPADLYGELFRAVQLGRVFPDGKTFVDVVPKRPPAAIMADYRRDRPAGDALRRFVLANFVVPGVNDVGALPLREHIRRLWPTLARPAKTAEPGGSAIALPAPYVVPGGRFREIYYWDSYFTMLGLRVDGQGTLVESMLDGFTSLVERYGRIPNGTRTYYLSRSQPPFFALMLDLGADAEPATAARRLRALRREHGFWMEGARVVRMPDGSLLNRYGDDRDVPRDESYAEDVATAREAAPRPAAQTYRDLRAGAESGWDYSSRWLRDGRTLASVRTTDIVPIDLNSLLYAAERRIAERCRAVADAACAAQFGRRADRRRAAIDRYLWLPGERRYADWSLSARGPTTVLSAATLYPLFVGLASADQARAVAATTRERLLAPGGLRTTLVVTGQQWDRPNGWAPLQWIAVEGLARTGHEPLAREVAVRWLATVGRVYRETGRMLEKYDVEEIKPGGGGEYPTQDGFGWTNGVTSALLERYPDLDPAVRAEVAR
ncbi:alpha,alpha-trehalase TreF [Sphingomonas lenta]|uniref:alpha,alpha-trehalase TreF n=1 Tax=Sphingomonas lenta TaxID=1141887 RepID=UPI001FE85B5C|nr:alpha,alpha-trehalase TreF [Sphingomonas lenta]